GGGKNMKRRVLFVLGALVFLLGMGWSSSAFAESEVAKLLASDVAAEGVFGKSVAISGDTVVIGAYRDDDNGTNSGSAYIFQRSGSDWTKQVKIIFRILLANT
ncbi:unnamed protein product, partial [marine sediment metagenome]